MPRLVDVRYSRSVRLSDLRRAAIGASEAHSWAATWGRHRTRWTAKNTAHLKQWWSRQLDRAMGETGVLGPSGGAVYVADISPSERQTVIAEMGSGIRPGSPLNSIVAEYPDAADVASFNRFVDAHYSRQRGRGIVKTDPAPTPSSPPAEPNLCAEAAYCRVFVGVDPGRCGSVAIMFAGQRPDCDADHGRVLAVSVHDLPQRSRDDGGSELDIPAFALRVMKALMNPPSGYKVANVSGLVERPDVVGGMRFGAASIVTQGVAVGAVHAALEMVLAQCGVESSGVKWVSGGGGGGGKGGWRGELGCVAKGEEAPVVMAIRSTLAGAESMAEFTRAVSADAQCLNDTRPDRLVAVLIAEVGRRRWLGQAVTPKTKGTTKAAKAKRKDRRKDAVARAVAPLPLQAARLRAVLETVCVGRGHNADPQERCDKYTAGKRIICCEARLLDWAWRQRPDLPGPPVRTVGLAHAIKSLSRMQHIFKKAVTSKAWTVDLGEGLATMDAEVFDGLETHGLIQLISGESAVRYRPTERGLARARRLRGETT